MVLHVAVVDTGHAEEAFGHAFIDHGQFDQGRIEGRDDEFIGDALAFEGFAQFFFCETAVAEQERIRIGQDFGKMRFLGFKSRAVQVIELLVIRPFRREAIQEGIDVLVDITAERILVDVMGVARIQEQ